MARDAGSVAALSRTSSRNWSSDERVHAQRDRPAAYGGASQRRIARLLGIARKSVAQDWRRTRTAALAIAGQGSVRRPSLLDPFADQMAQLVDRYPHLTAVRLYEELRRLGFQGRYIRLCAMAARSPADLPKPPVARFETAPGLQPDGLTSPFEIDFTAEGRRRFTPFSYIWLTRAASMYGFVETQDFATTIREQSARLSIPSVVWPHCFYTTT